MNEFFVSKKTFQWVFFVSTKKSETLTSASLVSLVSVLVLTSASASVSSSASISAASQQVLGFPEQKIPNKESGGRPGGLSGKALVNGAIFN